jgi:hypothetical protein
MKGMKSCPKCKGGECKGGKGCMMEDKEKKMESNGKKGVTVAIMVALPKRGARTAKTKAKKSGK